MGSDKRDVLDAYIRIIYRAFGRLIKAEFVRHIRHMLNPQPFMTLEGAGTEIPTFTRTRIGFK